MNLKVFKSTIFVVLLVASQASYANLCETLASKMHFSLRAPLVGPIVAGTDLVIPFRVNFELQDFLKDDHQVYFTVYADNEIPGSKGFSDNLRLELEGLKGGRGFQDHDFIWKLPRNLGGKYKFSGLLNLFVTAAPSPVLLYVCSKKIEFDIPSFEVIHLEGMKDILPPSLTKLKVIRDGNSVTVNFTATKDNLCTSKMADDGECRIVNHVKFNSIEKGQGASPQSLDIYEANLTRVAPHQYELKFSLSGLSAPLSRGIYQIKIMNVWDISGNQAWEIPGDLLDRAQFKFD